MRRAKDSYGEEELQLYIMLIIGARGERRDRCAITWCPVTGNMSFDSHLVGSHVVYRLMAHMDRGRRNFVSEASRRTSVNRQRKVSTSGGC